ncbi:peroxidase TAP [Rhizoctonia solani AG-1 IA]|uniref:Peroxidase TAP n=2 Tax=Rhizoctonia solani TaxID=456999 RepID=L8WES0_THACA|nr:peroxidase TAP [Rhizoctonia solani AG-1 IA]
MARFANSRMESAAKSHNMSIKTLTADDYEEIWQHERDKRLLKLLRGRGQVPLIPESDSDQVPQLDDIQGDVLFRFPKTYERFIFFNITNKNLFLEALGKFEPTTAADVKKNMLDICQKKEDIRAFNNLQLEMETAKEKAERLRKEAEELKKKAEELESGEKPNKKTKDDQKPKHERVPLKQKLIALTREGLNELGFKDETGDDRFDGKTMLDDRTYLGDQSDWDLLFDWKQTGGSDDSLGRTENKNRKPTTDRKPLHGVIVIATETESQYKEVTNEVEEIFKDSWKEMGTLDGNVRPNENRGHEHFGFLDGISQPSIRGIEHPLPGQLQVDPGVIVMGYPGDPVPKSKRAPWAKGGTMMVFRKLEQSVIEFDEYCKANGPRWREFFPGGEVAANQVNFDEEDGADLFAARFVGRWKSGAPLALSPWWDDKELATDPKRNNDFDYTVTGVPGVSAGEPSDYYCPFTAHARKTVPRNLDPYISRKYFESSAIVRAAIPYGPELDPKEREEWRIKKKEAGSKFVLDPEDRGLLFSCYASHLDSGFVRQTTGFGNNDFFPITSLTPTKHGQDPIIGGPPAKNSSGVERQADLDQEPTKPFKDGDQVDIKLQVPGDTLNTYRVNGHVQVKPLTQKAPPGADNPFFVTSRGGEYFFVPSISTIDKWTGKYEEKRTEAKKKNDEAKRKRHEARKKAEEEEKKKREAK